jgi:hypothetical protein
VSRPLVYAIVLNHAERELLIRVVGEWAKRHDSPMVVDVLAMLEGAVDDRALAEFKLAEPMESPS